VTGKILEFSGAKRPAVRGLGRLIEHGKAAACHASLPRRLQTVKAICDDRTD
jgi:hypothetical protein